MHMKLKLSTLVHRVVQILPLWCIDLLSCSFCECLSLFYLMVLVLMFLTAKWFQNHEVVIFELNLKSSWIAKREVGKRNNRIGSWIKLLLEPCRYVLKVMIGRNYLSNIVEYQDFVVIQYFSLSAYLDFAFS